MNTSSSKPKVCLISVLLNEVPLYLGRTAAATGHVHAHENARWGMPHRRVFLLFQGIFDILKASITFSLCILAPDV